MRVFRVGDEHDRPRVETDIHKRENVMINRNHPVAEPHQGEKICYY